VEIISRKDAKAAGLKRFFTGEPCKFGHVAQRLVSNRFCVTCNAANPNEIAKAREEFNALLLSGISKDNLSKVVSRKEAKQLGEKRYFTGLLCKNGHIDYRETKSGGCASCAKISRAKSIENRTEEKAKEIRKIKNEKAKEYRKKNLELSREYGRLQYRKNKEKKKAQVKRYYLSVRYTEKHMSKHRERQRNFVIKNPSYAKTWAIENKDKVNAKAAKHRANKLEATPPWLTKAHLQEIETFYDAAQLIGMFSDLPWDVDHIVPLRGKTVRGLHVPWNLQLLPASENRSKGNRMPEAIK
jgi:hypothetical protein